MINNIVLDANILIKLFRDEADSDAAFSLVERILKYKIKILAPELLISETMDVLLSKGFEPKPICDFFRKQIQKTIFVHPINIELIELASEMAQEGHRKSGYPSYPDSLYHSLAIQEETIFITADKVHFDKAEKKYKNIALLKDWEKFVK